MSTENRGRSCCCSDIMIAQICHFVDSIAIEFAQNKEYFAPDILYYLC